MCSELMSWFVKRGADLSDSEPQTYRFYKHIRVSSRPKVVEQVRESYLLHVLCRSPKLMLDCVIDCVFTC
jgi:hypothetical protein